MAEKIPGQRERGRGRGARLCGVLAGALAGAVACRSGLWPFSLAAAGSSGSTPPIVLADEGYFFVGGSYVPAGDKDRKTMAGQMYVQYLIPPRVRQPTPLVLMHGTAQTGNCFLRTPDDRRGWAYDFAARGYRVYVIDQVGRGRSGASPDLYGPYARLSTSDLETLYTGPENYRLFPQAERHTQWPGGAGVAGNPAFDQFYASQVESIASGERTEELMHPALLALLEKIGPAVLLAHSQAGPFAWKLADARPDLVRAIVAVEPNGPPFHDIRFEGGRDWYRDSEGTARPWGITRVPLGYEPAARQASGLALARQQQADGPGLVRCWLQAPPARQLPRLARVPIAIVTGEASFRAGLDHCTSAFLGQAGVANTHLRLEAENVRGNGHMMMLEKNSSEVAAVIARWLERTLE